VCELAGQTSEGAGSGEGTVKIKQKLARLFASALVRSGKARWALAGVLVLGLAAKVPPIMAQPPQSDVAASKMPEKSYMAKSALYLPVIVDDRARSGLREILLYVKDGPNSPWLLKLKAPPSQTGFEYRLPQDGEYWFNVVTVDQSGKATPADVAAEPPAVIVVLDTCGPQVELKPLPQSAANPDGQCVKCEVHDANPNPFQTHFEYQTGDRVWRSLEPMPNQTDCFCIPHQAVLTGLVKVTCCDKAMNTTVKEFNLTMLGGANSSADVATASPKTVQQAGFVQETPAVVHESHSSVAAGSKPEENTKAGATPAKLKNAASQCPEKMPMTSDSTVQEVKGTCELTTHFKPNDAKWMLVNQRHVSLEYQIQDEGKSGVGKVEVWITEDSGKTWDVLCDDPDKKSPIAFTLPHEGVFGICLVVTNGRGFGGNPPKSGDAPDYIVELDTTKPRAELRSVKLGPSDDNACLDIVWQADDKNLSSTPIDLFYSVSPEGPWTPIAKGAANSGKYRWYLPQEVCREAYVRMDVKDMAGNCTRCEVNEPVILDDMSRPRAIIHGISTVVPAVGHTGGN
jgi:hypothetical protein